MTPRGGLLLAGLLLAAATPLEAQSSIFGIRGLGIPTRPISVRAAGSGGAFASLDPESATNPASIGAIGTATGIFTGLSEFRSSTTPGGDGEIRTARFPLVMFAGPVPNSPFALSVGVASYADRDYALVSTDTLVLGGTRVSVLDTIASRGGINDVRLAASWLKPGVVGVGLGVHFLSGSTRMEARRRFEDPTFANVFQTATLSYSGMGLSLGAIARPLPGLYLSGMARTDTRALVKLDSTEAYRVDLPVQLVGGLQYRIGKQADIAASIERRSWGTGDSALVALGAPGARDTWAASFGVEIFTDRTMTWRRPIRLGARYGTLPFLAAAGQQPSEWAVSVGTGTRLAAGRAGFDVSVERVRRQDGTGRAETGWYVATGVSVRP